MPIDANIFENLTGFNDYGNYERFKNTFFGNFDREEGILKIGSRSFKVGKYLTPRLDEKKSELAELSLKLKEISYSAKKTSAQNMVGDFFYLHKFNQGIFQMASQFNSLEFSFKTCKPEDGVAIYEFDLTQGPAGALAAIPGTIYRNYLVPIKDGMAVSHDLPDAHIGQDQFNQINCLTDIQSALINYANQLGYQPKLDETVEIQEYNAILNQNVKEKWQFAGNFFVVKNGYVESSENNLRQLNFLLEMGAEELKEIIKNSLRVGIQRDTEVSCQNYTLDQQPRLVTQIYTSALSIAYSSVENKGLWEPLARIILEASYDHVIIEGLRNNAKRILEGLDPQPIFLTMLGGGVFGNEPRWIKEAISQAITKIGLYDIDCEIKLIHFRRIDELYDQRFLDNAIYLAVQERSTRLALEHDSALLDRALQESVIGDVEEESRDANSTTRQSVDHFSSELLTNKQKFNLVLEKIQYLKENFSGYNATFYAFINGDITTNLYKSIAQNPDCEIKICFMPKDFLKSQEFKSHLDFNRIMYEIPQGHSCQDDLFPIVLSISAVEALKASKITNSQLDQKLSQRASLSKKTDSSQALRVKNPKDQLKEFIAYLSKEFSEFGSFYAFINRQRFVNIVNIGSIDPDASIAICFKPKDHEKNEKLKKFLTQQGIQFDEVDGSAEYSMILSTKNIEMLIYVNEIKSEFSYLRSKIDQEKLVKDSSKLELLIDGNLADTDYSTGNLKISAGSKIIYRYKDHHQTDLQPFIELLDFNYGIEKIMTKDHGFFCVDLSYEEVKKVKKIDQIKEDLELLKKKFPENVLKVIVDNQSFRLQEIKPDSEVNFNFYFLKGQQVKANIFLTSLRERYDINKVLQTLASNQDQKFINLNTDDAKKILSVEASLSLDGGISGGQARSLARHSTRTMSGQG